MSGRANAVPGSVGAQIGGEDAQRGADQPGRAVRMAAGPPAVDQRGELGRLPGPVAGRLAAAAEPRDRRGQLRQAVAARATLPGALPGQIAGEAGGLGEAAGPRRQHVDEPGPWRGVPRGEARTRERDVGGVARRQPGAAVAADP